jgi:nitrite reductase/ring-hydroxylating ferredoxin subunit
MDRKEFITKTCIACTSLTLLSSFIESCTTVRYASGTLNDNGLLLDLEEFDTMKEGKRAYVIARNESLQFPICVYRIDENTYSAVLMQCTHQGAELQVAGDQLTCPAHGSEFDRTGKVMQGPAAMDLRSFPVSINNDQLFIDLRKRS